MAHETTPAPLTPDYDNDPAARARLRAISVMSIVADGYSSRPALDVISDVIRIMDDHRRDRRQKGKVTYGKR